MSEAPWLTIVGLGEDGPAGLSPASAKAIERAEVLMGSARHLDLVPEGAAERVVWPVPFVDGLNVLAGLRGRRVVVLASGDPFWFGAGSAIARTLEPGEWRALPGNSCFSRVAAHLGWTLETTLCLGLHAAPFARLRTHLAEGQRAIVTVRDGTAVADLAAWLAELGFGGSDLVVAEAVGGPRERYREVRAQDFDFGDVAHPVAVAIKAAGEGMPQSAGRPDGMFEHDGQITKRPIRALTLSTLAPRAGETLWDLGAGSGSIAIEWLMSHPATQAVAVEAQPERAARIVDNAMRLGQDRLEVVTGVSLDVLERLPKPDAVFVGGGLSDALLSAIWGQVAPGTRVVANAVTLETEAVLVAAKARLGGELMRIEVSTPAPIGGFSGWKAAYPVVQWSAVR